MRPTPLLASTLLATTALLLLPTSAVAGPHVTFVLGALIGDELTDVTQTDPSSIRKDFDNAGLYGARLGWDAYPFALEGSLVVSPSAINVIAGETFDARLIYAEADLQLVIFPGPISPFIGAGIGLHNIKLETADDPSETVIGYVVGGGIKAGLGNLALRVDLRDHITPLKVSNLDATFRSTLGIASDTTLHNVELSAALSVRF